jgi:hypothetical protein
MLSLSRMSRRVGFRGWRGSPRRVEGRFVSCSLSAWPVRSFRSSVMTFLQLLGSFSGLLSTVALLPIEARDCRCLAQPG